MRFWKNFGIVFVYPVMLFGTGFLGGAAFMEYFYPGRITQEEDNVKEDVKWEQISGTVDADKAGQEERTEVQKPSKEAVQTSVIRENLNADTAYVLEEKDVRNDTVVETVLKLPAKYIGMNRQEFLEAMDSYAVSPPLEELERGFVGLEVLSFSPEKVVVQMNYEYVLPGESYYLTVEDNYVVVYLEDRQTIYMDTEILLTELPEEIQQQIIQMMYIPDEESLYDFLENYSS